jgi:hypothetical protein
MMLDMLQRARSAVGLGDPVLSDSETAWWKYSRALAMSDLSHIKWVPRVQCHLADKTSVLENPEQKKSHLDSEYPWI